MKNWEETFLNLLIPCLPMHAVNSPPFIHLERLYICKDSDEPEERPCWN